jgi:hypothetical protein
LNTPGALWHLQYGTALVDAIGPVPLIGWSAIGPWLLLREINAVCAPATPGPTATIGQQVRRVAAAEPVLIPAGLLASTRELDAEHRAATGRPVSRDNLRSRLRISRDRASALVGAVRAEASGAQTLPVHGAA